jgi:ATP-binding cassette subfamily B protein
VSTLLIFAVFENLTPYFYKQFVDAAFSKDFSGLLHIFVLYVGIRVSELIFEQISRIAYDYNNFNAGRDARIDIFSKIHDLDFAFHLSKSTGSLISTMRRGDGAFFDLSEIVNFDLPRLTIGFVIAIGFIFSIRYEIALVVLVAILINIMAAIFLVKQNLKKRQEWNDEEDRVSGIITDNLINFDTVKLFAKESWEQKRLTETMKVWMQKLWGFAYSFRMIEVVSGVLGNASIIATLGLSLYMLSQGELTPGEFVLILGFVTGIYPKFTQMVFRLRALAKSYADLDKYFAILGNELTVKDPKKAIRPKVINGDVNFDKVTFTYPEGKNPVLKDFSLDIKRGQSIALVGKSGMGKSTIIKLLMRFYDIQSGEISIDGVNIKKMEKSFLRSFIGVVPQEPILFNNSIAFNVGYGALNPTLEQVQAACKMAYLDDFIETLPLKYETNVGERGIKLSGGQKQRLAIARMILSNPEIVIFDEATSHLDSESERAIQEAFWKAVQGKTTIVVAHRLATIVKADKIVVVNDGGIAEIGSHRALLQKKDGIYAHYWSLQTDID